MPDYYQLVYFSPLDLSSSIMNVVLKTGCEMAEDLDILPPVDLLGYEPERLAMFASDNNGAFLMVAYKGVDGSEIVSHYLGPDCEYERCMSNGSEIESYTGRINHLGAVIRKGSAEVHNANALKVLECTRFLAGVRYTDNCET